MWACGDSSTGTKPEDTVPDTADTADAADTADTADSAELPEVAPTGCSIDGSTYPSGAVDPTNACRSCDLATPTAWTVAADGADCGTGRCVAGECVERPRIDRLTPSCAANRGGDQVAVLGAHFAEGVTATLGGQPAALTRTDDKNLTLTVPAAPNTRGEVPLIVTNPDGQSGTSATPFRLFGGLAFDTPRTVPLDAIPGRFATGDVDGDGKDDLVLPLTPLAAIQVARLGQSSGTFGEIATLPNCDPSAVAVLEATGDTLADVVAVCADGLKVYAGTAGGVPTLVAGTPIAMALARDLVAGHFDDDGIADLAISYNTSNDIAIYRGNGNGTFTASGTITLDTNAAWLDAGDLTGDGLDDLVAAQTENNALQVILATGDGAFAAPAAPMALAVARPGTVHLARIDTDELEDLVVSSQDSEVSASWFRSLGDGTFGERVNFTSGGLIGAAVGDFNEDGLGDAITNSGPGILVFPGNGDGTFDCTLALAMERAPQYLLVGDFDGNGRLDIAGRNVSLSEATLILQAAP